jgi:DNA-binding NarL/FixJ family response regulator
VLIVDDHPVIRHGLKVLIAQEEDLEICGEAADVQQALGCLQECHPNVVVLDLTLKDSHGFTALAVILSHAPRTKVLVWSGHDEELFAERVLRAGAMGFVSKSESPARVIEGIRQVLRGEVCVSGPVATRLLGQMGHNAVSSGPMSRLSNRELEIFEFLGQGLSAKEIARRMTLSIKTVETHRDNIKRKLQIGSSGELIRRTVEWNLQMQGSTGAPNRAKGSDPHESPRDCTETRRAGGK